MTNQSTCVITDNDYNPSEYQKAKLAEVGRAILRTPSGDVRNLLTEYALLLQTRNIFTDDLSLLSEHPSHQGD